MKEHAPRTVRAERFNRVLRAPGESIGVIGVGHADRPDTKAVGRGIVAPGAALSAESQDAALGVQVQEAAGAGIQQYHDTLAGAGRGHMFERILGAGLRIDRAAHHVRPGRIQDEQIIIVGGTSQRPLLVPRHRLHQSHTRTRTQHRVHQHRLRLKFPMQLASPQLRSVRARSFNLSSVLRPSTFFVFPLPGFHPRQQRSRHPPRPAPRQRQPLPHCDRIRRRDPADRPPPPFTLSRHHRRERDLHHFKRIQLPRQRHINMTRRAHIAQPTRSLLYGS